MVTGSEAPGRKSHPNPLLPWLLCGEEMLPSLRRRHTSWVSRISSVEAICRGVLPAVEPGARVLVFPYGPLPDDLVRAGIAENVAPFLQSLLRTGCWLFFLVPRHEPDERKGAWWSRTGDLVSRVDPRVRVRVLPHPPSRDGHGVQPSPFESFFVGLEAPGYALRCRVEQAGDPEIRYLAGFHVGAPTAVRWGAAEGEIVLLPLPSLEVSTEHLETLLDHDFSILVPERCTEGTRDVPISVNGKWHLIRPYWWDRMRDLYDASRSGIPQVRFDEAKRKQVKRLRDFFEPKGVLLWPAGGKRRNVAFDPTKRILLRIVRDLEPPPHLS